MSSNGSSSPGRGLGITRQMTKLARGGFGTRASGTRSTSSPKPAASRGSKKFTDPKEGPLRRWSRTPRRKTSVLTRRNRELTAAQDAAKKMRHMEASTWTVAPDKSHWVQNWDAALCAALVYTAVVTPAEVAFIQKAHRVNDYVWFFLINMCFTFIFILDVGLQFFLHYQLPKDKGNTWVRNHRRIVRHYLFGYFGIDFLSSFPYGLFEQFGGNIFGDLAAARLLRLLRLAKLLRILRTSRLITRYRADLAVSYGIIHLTSFIVATVLFSHWLACIWGFTANTSSKGISNSWMGAFEEKKWNIRNPKHQYVISLYFAIMTLTTVGYGDVIPTNISEYSIMIVMMCRSPASSSPVRETRALDPFTRA